ncbi:PREDICTED: trem-like transcript 2 protein [Crocodylus porosus]|uniref:trem-like transcript 2 protein n=1 Tax=Crocodylus porosus TaxID=8502 RepID=UPI00093C7541|nr:PREDICTED: trem-like transcript 2 protein [Crocodylus porosus]
MDWRARLLLPWLGLCIPGLQAQGYVPVESREEGETLSVQCPYNQPYRKMLKGWLRGEIDLLVSTQHSFLGAYQNKVTVGRTTIQDDTDKGIVTITMKMLQVRDAGVYTCTAYAHNRWFPLKTIDLRVSQRVQEHKAVEGQKLTVRCPYSARDYGGEGKAWCRYVDEGYCSILVSTYSSYGHYRYRDQAKRTTIHDNAQNGTVTITMDKLQADDSGVYRCTLYASPRLYRLLEVQLAVSKAPTTSMSLTTAIIITSPETTTRNSRLPLGDTPFITFGVVLGVLLALALISSIILYIRQRKKRGKGGEQAEGIYDKPGNPTVLQDVGKTEDPKDDREGTSEDPKYAILNFKSQTSPNESIYANVEPSQGPITRNNFPTEPVEYATIALKPLPSGSKE